MVEDDGDSDSNYILEEINRHLDYQVHREELIKQQSSKIFRVLIAVLGGFITILIWSIRFYTSDNINVGLNDVVLGFTDVNARILNNQQIEVLWAFSFLVVVGLMISSLQRFLNGITESLHAMEPTELSPGLPTDELEELNESGRLNYNHIIESRLEVVNANYEALDQNAGSWQDSHRSLIKLVMSLTGILFITGLTLTGDELPIITGAGLSMVYVLGSLQNNIDEDRISAVFSRDPFLDQIVLLVISVITALILLVGNSGKENIAGLLTILLIIPYGYELYRISQILTNSQITKLFMKCLAICTFSFIIYGFYHVGGYKDALIPQTILFLTLFITASIYVAILILEAAMRGVKFLTEEQGTWVVGAISAISLITFLTTVFRFEGLLQYSLAIGSGSMFLHGVFLGVQEYDRDP